MRTNEEMKILHQAQQLEEAAGRIRAEQRELADCRGSIGADWKGDSAEVFLRKVSAVEEELEGICRSLRVEAEMLRSGAGRDR